MWQFSANASKDDVTGATEGTTMQENLGSLLIMNAGQGIIYDNDSDYCEIALETDANRIIRRIYIIEPSILCNTVLK